MLREELIRCFAAEQSKTTDVAVAVELRDEAVMRRRPYLATKKDLHEEREQAALIDQAKMKKQVVAAAERGRLTPDEVMMIAYTVFGDDEARRVFAQNILTHQGQDRIRRHNFFVAERNPDAWWFLWGQALLSCPWPLFPNDDKFPELEKLNSLMLEAVRDSSQGVAGAGTSSVSPAIARIYRLGATPSSPWAASGSVAKVFRQPEVEGAGYLPVQVDASGNATVDVTDVEAAYNVLLQQQQQIQRRIAELGRATGRQGYNQPREPRRCFNCGAVGHIGRFCPKKARNTLRGGGETADTERTKQETKQESRPRSEKPNF